MDVWKQRAVFSPETLSSVSARITSKANGTASSPLDAIQESYKALQVATLASTSAVSQVNALFDALQNTQASADLAAARTRQCVQAIKSSESALKTTIQQREALIKQIKEFEQVNFTALENDQNSVLELSRKQAVLEESPRQGTPEMERPQVEALTPPGSPNVNATISELLAGYVP